MSLRLALEFLVDIRQPTGDVLVRGDSMLVIQQMSGRWRIKAGAYVPYAQHCRRLAVKIPRIKFQWIPREQNNMADDLSKKELISHSVRITKRD